MWGKRKSGHEEEAPAGGPVSPPTQSALAIEDMPSPQSAVASEAKPKTNGAEPSVTNGTDGMEAVAVPNGARQGPTVDEIRFSVTFTRIVSVLSRSPHYKHYTLSDLEWLVMPPILTGQCAVMEAKASDRQMPVAVALWASVSNEVDKRLSDLIAPIRLRPDEWRSGNVLWLVDAVGDSRAIPLLLLQLQQTVLKGQEVKTRLRREGTSPGVHLLDAIVSVKEEQNG